MSYVQTKLTKGSSPAENTKDVTGSDVPTDKRALDIFLAGVASGINLTVTQRGLNVGGLITEVTLNDTTWTALPATPLTDRNSMAIQNISGNQIKINYSPLVVGYVGVTIESGDERQYDVTDNVIIYAKSESGTSPTIQVEELA